MALIHTESEMVGTQESMGFAATAFQPNFPHVEVRRQTNIGLIPREAERVLMNRLGVVALPPLWVRQFVSAAVLYSVLRQVDETDAMQRLIGPQPGSLPALPGDRRRLQALNTKALNRLSILFNEESTRGLFRNPCGDYGQMVSLLEARTNTTTRGW